MPRIALRLRSLLVAAVAAAFMVLPALLFVGPVWADTAIDSTTSATPSTNDSQTAASGIADVTANPPTADPTTIVDPTTTTDPTTSVDSTTPTGTIDQTPVVPTPQAASGSDPTTGQAPSDPTPGCTQPNTNVVQPTSDTTTPDTTQTTADGSSLTTNQTVAVNNNLCNAAQSGDAGVTNVATGGNAATGSGQTVATLLNLLQSITGLSGNNLTTFTQDITGNVNGNIYIDPGTIATDPTVGCPTACSGSGLAVNTTTNGQINNNITLNAGSGNATVSNNGNGGTATTGNANTLLNLINIINSLINSNQSFIGTINIYGNLNGDILLPANFFDSLLAADPSSSSGSPTAVGSSLSLNNSDSINNNIDLNATSGNATVNNSGHGGSAGTGNATTNLTLLNLTNQQIVGSNDLLVFVNVLGQWYGLIFNAPVGTTSADLGGGVSPASGLCTCSNLSLASTNTSAITNNVLLNSVSGNATVSNSGHGGNASTGNANASANIVNIINSELSLTNWFGILFINVFGSWIGSLETSPVVASTTTSPPANDNQPQTSTFKFIPAAGPVDPAPPASSPPQGHVLSASTFTPPSITNGSGGNSLMRLGLLTGLVACCGLLAGLERRKKSQDEVLAL